MNVGDILIPMRNEIERKFFVRVLPSLKGIEPLAYERYILDNQNGKEVRIQKVNDVYFYEEKSTISDLERSRVKKEISEQEFNFLKLRSSGKAIIRERYNLGTDPDIAIQIYHGDFEGLVRAEVEFCSEEEAKSFRPLEWMGPEMTGLPIARDGALLSLSKDEFKKYISSNS